MELEDGTIIQDGLRVWNRNQNDPKNFSIPYPVTAIVKKVYYNDDSKNREGSTIVCDCYSQMMGVDLYKVPMLLPKGSVDNYIYYALLPHTANVDKSPSNDVRINPQVSDGDSVLIQFANGDFHNPYITAVLPHNQSGYKTDGNAASPSPRPGKSEGECLKIRFNGTNFQIDKDGNVSYESTPTYNPDTPTHKKWELTWNVEDPLLGAEDQKVEVLYDNKEGDPSIFLKVTDDTAKVSSIKISKAGIEISTEADFILNITGDIIQNISGDLTLEATGDATIKATNVTVEASALATVKGQNVKVEATQNAEVTALTAKITATQSVEIKGTTAIELNKAAGGNVLTTITMPVVDNITGQPSVGVPTVIAG